MTKNGFVTWPVLLVIILASLGVGFFLGRMDFGGSEAQVEQQAGVEADAVAGEQAGDAAEQAPQASADTESEPAKQGLTSKELASQKNVPESVKSAQGDFALVTVIESEDANRTLQRSLQVVGAQRRRLAQLTNNYNRTDPQMTQQRELIAGQINEARQSLGQNLRFMAQNFGYTLSNNYLLVPHRATLNTVIGTGEDQIKTEVYAFKDSLSYRKFQEKTDAYSQLKRAQLTDYRETQTEEEKKQPLPKLPLTGEMEKLRKEMIGMYKCDPERNYMIEIQKAALYARPAQ